MALGFIKKVFSFGQKKEEKTKQRPAQPDEKLARGTNRKTTAKTALSKKQPAQKPAAAKTAAGAQETGKAATVKTKTAAQTKAAVKNKKRQKNAAAKIVSHKDNIPAAAPQDKTKQAVTQKAVAAAQKPKHDALTQKTGKGKKAAAKPGIAQTAKQQKATVKNKAANKQSEQKAVKPSAVQQAAETKATGSNQNKAAVSVSHPGGKPASPSRLRGGSGKVSIGDILEIIESAPTAASTEPGTIKTSKAASLSWFDRLKSGLSRSSRHLGDSIGGLLTKRKLDAETLEDLEDVLIQADLGLETVMRITDTLGSGRFGKNISTDDVKDIMAGEIRKTLEPVAQKLELDINRKPHVILVVGVNGTGKTTTIGKLAQKLTAGGLSVMLAAGDTFRAAAIEQLHIWGERTGSAVVSSKLGSDAASLAYDAYAKAKEAGSDVLIIDTAGRLQNKAELMDELAKIVRVLGKHDADAPHTVLQTLDATTGQNALNQVEIFRNVAGVNGLVMTKLDGTARGGILVAIAAKHKLPVHFIGVGEAVDDLEPFSAAEFAEAITGNHKAT